MGADEVSTLKDLTERRTILDGFITTHGGRIANTAGDSVLAQFGSAVDAVQCAVEAQAALAEANSSLSPDRHINFRIGIHIGDVMVKGGDLFGDGVNIAARLQALASAGGICISSVAFDQVRKILPLAFTDLGARQVKNIDEAIRAYAITPKGAATAGTVSPAAVPSSNTALPLPDKASIAVLPFQNMSGDPEQDYFADGMVEEIITALARFNSLLVIARNSSFTYKGKLVDIKQAGRELGVLYILEGSVRKSGGRVRITGQLIEVATGAHLWADKVDGSLDDVFELQDLVTRSVVGAILPKLKQAQTANASRKPRGIWNCYDKYLRGNALLFQLSPASLGEAKSEYRQALSIDPDFAPALASLATCYVAQRLFLGQDLNEGELSNALELASRAAELAPDDGEVLAACAIVVTWLGDDLEKAMTLAERAVSLNPNVAMAWADLGYVRLLLGEPERACEAFERAARLNPLDRVTLVTQILPGTSQAFWLLGRKDEWLMTVNQLLALDPNNLGALLDALYIAREQGRSIDAERLRQRLDTVYPGLRKAQIRDLFCRFRMPEHRELFDRWLAGLPFLA